MKKTSLFTSFGFCTALLFVGCSDNDAKDIAGTVVDPNELAEAISSSSAEQPSDTLQSSSSVQATSSETVSDVSSSSQLPEFPTTESSSSRGGTTAVVDKPSLKAYTYLLGAQDSTFDNTVLASKVVYEKDDTDPYHDGGVASATEFGGPGIHKFVKQNIDALSGMFPEAAKEYGSLISDIKNGTNTSGCELYLLNVWGTASAVGHILAHVTAEQLTVLDITANGCSNTTNGKMVGFLFHFCGEMSKDPEILRVEVESERPISRCPAISPDDEWLKN